MARDHQLEVNRMPLLLCRIELSRGDENMRVGAQLSPFSSIVCLQEYE